MYFMVAYFTFSKELISQNNVSLAPPHSIYIIAREATFDRCCGRDTLPQIIFGFQSPQNILIIYLYLVSILTLMPYNLENPILTLSLSSTPPTLCLSLSLSLSLSLCVCVYEYTNQSFYLFFQRVMFQWELALSCHRTNLCGHSLQAFRMTLCRAAQ